MEGMDEDDLTDEQRARLKQIRARKAVVLARHRLKKGTANNQAVLPRRADASREINTRAMKVGRMCWSPASPHAESAVEAGTQVPLACPIPRSCLCCVHHLRRMSLVIICLTLSPGRPAPM